MAEPMPHVHASPVRPQRAGSKRQFGEDGDFGMDDESNQEVGSPVPPSSRKKSRRPGSKPLGPTQYHGVTHHVRSSRYEAHLWEERQLYLGGWALAEQAALAFDLAAIRYRGPDTKLNFHIDHYRPFLAALHAVSAEEVVAALRRRSRGGAVQSSFFRGVTRHQKGRWEARIGQTAGRRYLYLGLHSTEVEAARAYDLAAIGQKGVDAYSLLNFHLAEYLDDLEPAQVEEALQRGILIPEDLSLEAPTPAPAPALEEEAAQAMEGEGEGEAVRVGGTSGLRAFASTCDEEDGLAEVLFGVITKEDGMALSSPQSVLAPRTAAPLCKAAGGKGQAPLDAATSSLVRQLFGGM